MVRERFDYFHSVFTFNFEFLEMWGQFELIVKDYPEYTYTFGVIDFRIVWEYMVECSIVFFFIII